jgi:hypothetical protein
MGFILFFNKVTPGDLELFILGVTRKLDDLHAIKQRLGHVEAVRRRDEHDVRQIIINFKIMVVERLVLFGIEHFQKRR